MNKYIFLFATLVVTWACQSNQEADPSFEEVDKAYRELAIRNCGSCHRFPEPELLDKATWMDYVLPRMGYMQGIYEHEGQRDELIEDGPGGQLVDRANVFPTKALVDSADWNRILSYYYHHAPDTLKSPIQSEPEDLKIFKLQKPPVMLSPPSSTLVCFTEDHKIMLGDAHTGSIYMVSESLELESMLKIREGAVHMHETPNEWWVTVLGSFTPTDAPTGVIVKLPKDQSLKPKLVISNLQRPVDAVYHDFNDDGLMDIAVAEFGKWTGSLSLYENQGNDTFRKKIIENRSGAVKLVARDINEDGLMDIVALFGQGREALESFMNQGNGEFVRSTILEFPSSNGSSYFTMQDLDADGDEDILYTAGDNADYLPILKPYHGVYQFMNDGNFNFTQSSFIHLNGAYKAIPADFDGDGDLDIAAISFFPDYRERPNEGFMYYENVGGDYKSKTLDNVLLGRWISMDIGDYDQDGDDDLILGSLAFETVPVQPELESNWINRGLPFVILENQLN